MIDPPYVAGERRFASVRPALKFYGAPIGMLMLDRMPGAGVRPYIPGDAGNATTWSVPIRYKTVPGLNVTKIFGPNGGEATSAVIEAAKELVAEGAQMITSHCGYSIRYHEAVRDALDVPVFLSSLLLVPFLEHMIPGNKALGIIAASKTALTQDMLKAAGLRANFGRKVVVAGLENTPVFGPTWNDGTGDLDVNGCEKDVIDTALALLKERPEVGMLLLECGDLPPYAPSVQRATGLPVFDFTSLVEFFVRGLIRKPWTGFV
ncbi:hypothetical protein FXV83_40555 [Bradyrhizobium hipponense]|uniref:Aspartate/glutamate racemase family protein n=1 Tax=Bradyrhizobium hipponense TaxID=2605638 RepID=A0A5S4Y9D0_9BRAD|nr:aspartate/glutamate racemase family protein [Bradyrhizobium hipponense]TYO61006.1 hypothetical protein FXV83_40555 [Bradyrhizobium hipponense]